MIMDVLYFYILKGSELWSDKSVFEERRFG